MTNCFQEHKATDVSKGYRPGEIRCPGELLQVQEWPHLNQQLIKQRKQKTCLHEQGAPNLNKGRKHKNHIMAWEP